MGNHHGNRERSGREKLVESLKLPRDVCMGELRVTMVGRGEAWVENYRGILEYSACSILLQGNHCRICFEGEGLTIEYYTNDRMKIGGRIRCASFC